MKEEKIERLGDQEEGDLQAERPVDEILVRIHTDVEDIVLVRTQRSGMHAIQQND